MTEEGSAAESEVQVDVESLSSENLKTFANTGELPVEAESAEPEAGESASPEVSEVPEANEVPVEEEAAPEMLTVSKAEYDKLQEDLKNSQSMIGRQSTEVGNARQKEQELAARIKELSKTPDEYNDMFLDDPTRATREVTELTQAEQELNKVRDQVLEEESYIILNRDIPDFEAKLDKIGQYAIDHMGYDPLSVQTMKANPYKLNREEILTVAHNMEMHELRTEMAALRNAPGEVAQKIEAAANSSKPLTAATGQAGTAEPDITPAMIESMTTEQARKYAATGTI